MKLIMMIFVFIFFQAASSEVHAKDLPVCEKRNKTHSFNPRYAKGFSIEYYNDFKIVKSHFNNDQFIIADAEKALNCKSELYIFKSLPLRVALTSTTHLFSFKEFDLLGRLKAFQGTKYIGQKNAKIKDLVNLNFILAKEELIALDAGLIMAYSGNFKNDEMIYEYRNLNIPVVLNYDYIESHPLARLEWMVFTAAFFNLEQKAQDLFKQKAQKYEQAKSKYKNLKKSEVLVGEIQEGKWITPGAKSNLGVLISDAGGDLVLRIESEKTQLLSVESVVGVKNKIDIWLTHNFWTNKKNINSDDRYKLFRKLRTFNNNKKTNEAGFNDFWEDAQNYPELLIVELNHILHNKNMIETTWYHELL